MSDSRVEAAKLLLAEWKERREEAIKVIQQAEQVISGLERALLGIEGTPMLPLEPSGDEPAVLPPALSAKSQPKGIGPILLEILQEYGPLRAAQLLDLLASTRSIKVSRQAVSLQLRRLTQRGLVIRREVNSPSGLFTIYGLTEQFRPLPQAPPTP